MRYHNGLGVGHVYPSKARPTTVDEIQASSPSTLPSSDSDDEAENGASLENQLLDSLANNDNASGSESSDQDGEWSPDEDEGTETQSDEEDGNTEGDFEDEEDELALEYDEMYGYTGDNSEDDD